MNDTTPFERLQPALLDRLKDDDPAVSSEPRERRVMNKKEFRAAVLRDLTALFNATQMEFSDASRPRARIDLSNTPRVRRSVVNFGLPPMSGRPASAVEAAALERAIHQAIVDFEPRILPQSLRVTVIMHEDALDHHNVIGMYIHGQLWSQPVPLELLLRTDIDLEAGTVEITDSTDALPGAGA